VPNFFGWIVISIIVFGVIEIIFSPLLIYMERHLFSDAYILGSIFLLSIYCLIKIHIFNKSIKFRRSNAADDDR